MSYVISLAVGLLVGVAFALIGIRSPAAARGSRGMLGMVGGEQLVPMVRSWVTTPEKQVVADAQDITSQSARLAARSDRATELK
jgi:XapX domain-containing protein